MPRRRSIAKTQASNKTDILCSLLNTSSLGISIEQQAAGYFLANFVNIKSRPQDGLKFLSPLINGAREESPFHSTFVATSLASLASQPNSSSLIPHARVYYNKALKQISNSIQDTEKSIEDETLGAIIMLILYEARDIATLCLISS